MSDTIAPRPCKLCSGATRFRFRRTVLGRHTADYVECSRCGCLQIPETPWLAEAYASASWAIDTGLVARNLQLACTIGAFLERAVAPGDTVIDYGGGSGLLTRLLRDLGWEVLCYDAYHPPQFVRVFHVDSIAGCDARVIIASEVFEHFAEPRATLTSLLRAAPIIVFTTELYIGQGEDWAYLAPEAGQHIFFYSLRALQGLADEHGFELVDTGFLKYLVRKDQLARPADCERMIAAIEASTSVEAGLEGMTRYLRDPYRHVATDHSREWERWTASLGRR